MTLASFPFAECDICHCSTGKGEQHLLLSSSQLAATSKHGHRDRVELPHLPRQSRSAPSATTLKRMSLMSAWDALCSGQTGHWTAPSADGLSTPSFTLCNQRTIFWKWLFHTPQMHPLPATRASRGLWSKCSGLMLFSFQSEFHVGLFHDCLEVLKPLMPWLNQEL